MRDFSTAVKMLQGNYWLQIQWWCKRSIQREGRKHTLYYLTQSHHWRLFNGSLCNVSNATVMCHIDIIFTLVLLGNSFQKTPFFSFVFSGGWYLKERSCGALCAKICCSKRWFIYLGILHFSGGESSWGEPFKDELKPNLIHAGRGVLSMANSGPNTNKSQL